MRLSRTQKDVLFVLFAARKKGQNAPIPAVDLLDIVNRGRSPEVFQSNFLTSCHTQVDNGYLHRYRNRSMKLAFGLTELGVIEAEKIYQERVKA